MATNNTTAEGGGVPIFDQGGGPPSNIPGLETARRQLDRVRDMLQERLGDMGGWADGIGEAIRNLGGRGGEVPGMVVDPNVAEPAMEAISHLPEVLPW